MGPMAQRKMERGAGLGNQSVASGIGLERVTGEGAVASRARWDLSEPRVKAAAANTEWACGVRAGTGMETSQGI